MVTRKQIEAAKAEAATAQARLEQLRRECQHTLAPLTEEQQRLLAADSPKAWGKYDGACCQTCGEGFGWRCLKSPDGSCHYFSHEGMLTLIDGRRVAVPEGHDSKYESEDYCMFCGQPDERK